MRYPLSYKAGGFSLVELSIVIVIIGLIASSVLVGRSLIRGAEIRGLVSDLEKFNQAGAAFRERFGGVPGDRDLNTRYGIGVAYAGTGTENSILQDNAGNSSAGATDSLHDGEYVLFWNHLSATDLLPGNFNGADIATEDLSVTLPQAKAGGYWGAYSDGIDNLYIYGASYNGSDDAYFTESILSPRDVLMVEQKIDDTRPARGIVRARAANATEPLTAPIAACASATAYNLANDTAECTISVLMGI